MREKTEKILEYLNNATEFNADRTALLLNIYMEASKIACFNRTTIEYSENTILDEYPSIMGIFFSPQGTFKDRPKEFLELALNKVEQQQEMRKLDFFNAIEKKNKETAENLEKKEAREYLVKNRPRRFKNEMTGGTYQGLQTERLGCMALGLGHIHFMHGEFMDALNSKDGKLLNILSKIKESSSGKTHSDTLKGEESINVKGVPLTFMVHGTVDEIYVNDSLKQKLLSLIEGGFARRCFINFSNKSSRNDSFTTEQSEEMEKRTKELLKDVQKIYDEIYRVTAPFGFLGNLVYSKMSFSYECRDYLQSYKNWCFSEANKIKNKHKRSELNDRWLRAKRLSCCIALIEHPEDSNIQLEDISEAIDFSDVCGDSFAKFIDYDGDCLNESLVNMIQSKGGAKKTDIRKFIKKSQENYKLNLKGVDIFIKELKEYCTDSKLELVETKGSHNSITYSIIKQEEITIESKNNLCKISIGASNKDTETNFSDKREVEFEKLHEITKLDLAYSPTFFDGKRCGDNWTGGNNLVILDIDNDKHKTPLTLDKAKEVFNQYKCLLVTTRNHQKEKKELTVDRYRVIFQVEEMTFKEKEKWKNICGNIEEEFELKGRLDMGATGDVARFYFGNPNQEYWYSSGTKLLNWKYFLREKKEVKRYYSPKGDTKISENVKPDEVFTLPNGQQGNWNNFDSLRIGETKPVFCNYHQDKKPSAYIGRSENGDNNLYYKCSVCNILFFNK